MPEKDKIIAGSVSVYNFKRTIAKFLLWILFTINSERNENLALWYSDTTRVEGKIIYLETLKEFGSNALIEDKIYSIDYNRALMHAL